LLLAAAEPTGDAALLLRASERLAIPSGAAAATDGLLEFGPRVVFRHPLVRSTVYRAASLDERQRVHRALAEVTDPKADPDRRAWHRALATLLPEESVAAELERSADRAQARGGLAAPATFLARAASLTPDPARRVERTLAAAAAKYQAGSLDAALALLTGADVQALDEMQAARVDLLRAQLAFAMRRGSDAPPLLLAVAERLEVLDPALAQQTYLEALASALFVGRLVDAAGLRGVAEAVRQAPAKSVRPPARIVEGLATLLTDGESAGIPRLKDALRAFRSGPLSAEEELRWLWLACQGGCPVRRVSQAGFDGVLDSRILSSGEETLRRHGPSKEVPARAA
jgi:hypothetical protein